MTAVEYDETLARVEELLRDDPPLNTPLGHELSRLVSALVVYEAEHFPLPPQRCH